jgi:thioredoxin 1
MMEPVLEKIAANHGEKVKVVKINVDEEPELAARFDIVSIPSLIVFKKGEKVDMQVGAVSESVLERFLEKYI